MRINQSKVQLVSLLIVLGLCLPAELVARPSPVKKNAAAAKQYDRAVRLRTALEGKPLKDRALAEYEQVLDAFWRVYRSSPRSPKAPASLLARAEVYLEMARNVDPGYFDKAIEIYRLLLQEYPASRYGQDALLTIGEIQQNDLGNLVTARDTFQQFLERYPRSRRAVRARAAIEELEKAIERKATAQAKGKPEAEPQPSTLPQVTNIRHWNTQNYTRVVIDVDDEVKYQGARISNPDRIFFDLFDTKLSSALKGKTLEVGDGFLKKVRVAQNQIGVTRIVLEVDDIENYSVFSLPNPFRLVIDVYGKPSLTSKTAPKLEATPTTKETPVKSETEVSAEANPETPAREAPSAPKPAEAPAKPEPPASGKVRAAKPALAKAQPLPPPVKGARPTKNGSRTLTRALGLKIGRIVIDPGHGGHDTGTIGPTGFMEKDLVLDVALRLGKLIEDRLEAEVVYTREDDTFVPLENRTAVANEKQADLFLSIHANSSPDPSARGIETYFLNFTTDKAALDVAARENAVSQKSIHELQDIIKKIARNEKVEESREFATEIQSALYHKVTRGTHSIRNRGVKQAPFIVLVGASMPSVLAEIAFLSNPEDERVLKMPTQRQKLSEALYDGVVKYLQSLNSVNVALKPRRAEEKPIGE